MIITLSEIPIAKCIGNTIEIRQSHGESRGGF